VKLLAIILALSCSLLAEDHRGTVKLGTLPVPGATVTATQSGKSQVTLTDLQGTYSFTNLAAGSCTIKVEMRGFTTLEREVKIPSTADWPLTVLSLTEITAAPPPTVKAVDSPKAELKRRPKVPLPQAVNTNSGFQSAELKGTNAPVASAEISSDVARRANDGLLVNGSVNNAATSPFNQLPAFGNNRAPGKWPYNGNIGFRLGNSALDARPFSLTGQNTSRQPYTRFTGIFSFGGPIRIPRLLRNGPQFTLTYQWTRNQNATVQSALMPTPAERDGDFSQTRSVQVIDPTTGIPVPGNRIPRSQFSPQATSLLSLYPLPNFNGLARFNFQVPITSHLHQDILDARIVKQIGRKDNLSGTASWVSSRTDNPNLFGFLLTGNQYTVATKINWRHNFSSRLLVTLGYEFNRDSSRNIPFFSSRTNIAAIAGITGNNQDPLNWGPPTLNFANGIAPLGESQYAFPRNQSNGVTLGLSTIRGFHTFTYGGSFRRQQWNQLSQQDPRGTFTFTGAAAGSDFAGFLYGVPDTAQIAFGNADKYFRASAGDAYISDDWRFRSRFSLNLGVRYEYSAPINELYGRLVNLATTNNFRNASAIIERNAGPLLRADRNNIAPRIGFAWRPIATATMVIRGGYGIYYDSPLYSSIATQMAQQAPLSTSLRVQNSQQNPLTLASGFRGTPNQLDTVFGVDPAFRTGYAQNWQLSLQRDLPFALQIVATYLGIKGTRSVQQFLPNTFPAGAIDPCPTCPRGFSYMNSNGNSSRHAGTIQLRRRLRRGFSSEVQYTWSKALDNAALGGTGFLLAQDWLNLNAERGRSNFDQRHVTTFQTQYTTGNGIRGRLASFSREWNLNTQLNYATGFPLTPTFFAPVGGTGVTGSIRANLTGADPYAAPPGLSLNPQAFSTPTPGQWGNAGRNILTGPKQFTMTGSATRTFRWGDRLSADLRIEATNLLNQPVFPSWNTIISSAQFGLPNPAGQMRTLQTILRVRF
jgi:trimeric autotransporter adhesin